MLMIVVKAMLMLVVSEYTYCMAGVYCEFIFSRIYDLAKLAHFMDPYVTGFVKRSLIHESNFSTLRRCNSACS